MTWPENMRSSRSLYINPWHFSFSDVSRVWIKMFFCQEMNSHFWHFRVFYCRALVLILQYMLHFYLKRGTNNNLLFCECDFERFGFYAHMFYGFVFDGWNGTYLKKLLYIICKQRLNLKHRRSRKQTLNYQTGEILDE